MIEVFFVRHGQTQWNLEKKIQGVLDIPLNNRGLDEAKELALTIQSGFDSIISSPLIRAYKTAEILNENLGLKLTTDKRLMERNFGNLAGMEACFTKTMERSVENGVEPIEDFGNKILSFLEDIKKLGDGCHLVVAHGGVIITLLSILSNGELSWENTPIGNCSLTKISFKNSWKIDFFNKKTAKNVNMVVL